MLIESHEKNSDQQMKINIKQKNCWRQQLHRKTKDEKKKTQSGQLKWND